MFTKSLPNIFTIANLMLGIIAILLVFDHRFELAVAMVIIAMVTDGLDGRIARALNVQSEFGKELDSLSDIVSFGVAPALIMYASALQHTGSAGWIVTAIFPICGALRLARFNVVSGTPGFFIGLPIPAAGGSLATLALFQSQLSTIVLLISSLLLSYLMVSNLKYPSFKKRSLSKVTLWVTPFIVIAVVVLIIRYDGIMSKLVVIPLLLYALYGLKKSARPLFRLLRMKGKKSEETLEDNVKYHDL